MLKKIWSGLVEFFGSLLGVPSVIDRPVPSRRRKLGPDRGRVKIEPDFDDVRVNSEITKSFEGSVPDAYGSGYLENERKSWD